jgi:hypothetical protein
VTARSAAGNAPQRLAAIQHYCGHEVRP